MDRYPLCNHKKETAPHIFGATFCLCWRCTGVMLAFILMVLIREIIMPLLNTVNFFGIILMIPMMLDGYFQYFRKKESTNRRRFVTGFLFGIGFLMITFIYF